MDEETREPERCEWCGTPVVDANYGRTVDKPGAYAGVICEECRAAEEDEEASHLLDSN